VPLKSIKFRDQISKELHSPVASIVLSNVAIAITKTHVPYFHIFPAKDF